MSIKGHELGEKKVFPEKNSLKYRPDIDGLRAVAVLSVLAYHAEISRISGGFVGVDVFFVISGYLISSIIFSEIADARFSVAGFYERRIRRIFPALFVMLAVCTVFAAIYLLPGELVNYAKSVFAATVSASNFYFWRHSGYFDSPTAQPLLHTWSLAVEEQFYLSFPLLLIAIRKFFPDRLRTSVVALFVLSLLTSAVVVFKSPSTAFYLPFTRTWELLLGTLLSLGMFPRLHSPWLRNLATAVGMAMIGFSVLKFTESTLFPGLSALIPCIGSGLIIGAGKYGSSLIAKVLSWRPVVFVGLISYSLYLWHWPVIVLRHMGLLIGAGDFSSYRYAALVTSHRFDMFIEVAVSLALGTLSWRFVERPFRSGSLKLSGRPLFATTAAAMIVLLSVSSWMVASGGLKARFPVDARGIASSLDHAAEDRSMRSGTCFVTAPERFEDYSYDTCLHQDSSKKNYLLLGDSHSAMLWSALSSAFPDVNLMQASVAPCKPSLHPSGPPDCKKMMEYIFQTYLPAHPVQGLWVVGRWSAKDMGSLTTLIEWGKEHEIPLTVFGPVPEYDSPLPRLLAYSIAWNKRTLPSQHLVATSAFMDEEMRGLAERAWHVPYISLYREICSDGGCIEYADAERRIPLMSDTDHLTSFGASMLVRRLVEKRELH